jgi:hypothetical protein
VPKRESSPLDEEFNPNSKLETIEEMREKLQNAEEEIARLKRREELLGKRLDAAETFIRREEFDKQLTDADFRAFKMFVFVHLQPFINDVAMKTGLIAPQLPHFLNVGLRPEEPVPPKNDPPASGSGVKVPQHPLIRKQHQ